MKKLLTWSMTIVLLGVGSTAYAVITATNVSVGMKIAIDGLPEVTGSDTGTTFASVDITEPTTGANAASLLHINPLSNEYANLHFDISYDGNGTQRSGYMGDLTPPGNIAEIYYDAESNMKMNCAWNFDYIGPEPFGLQIIRVYQNGLKIEELGNYGIVGHHEGAEIFDLSAGSNYKFEVLFYPNVSGKGIGYIEGNLLGDISFNFVPEPATMVLLGIGGMALLGRQRK